MLSNALQWEVAGVRVSFFFLSSLSVSPAFACKAIVCVYVRIFVSMYHCD